MGLTVEESQKRIKQFHILAKRFQTMEPINQRDDFPKENLMARILELANKTPFIRLDQQKRLQCETPNSQPQKRYTNMLVCFR